MHSNQPSDQPKIFTPEILEQLGLMADRKIEDKSYTDKPVGPIVPSRIPRALVTGDAKIFLQRSITHIKHPKTIVLTDPTLCVLSDNYQSYFAYLWRIFKALIESGCTLKALCGNCIVNITTQLEYKDAIDTITPVHLEEAKRKINLLTGMAADDVVILDYFKLRSLVNQIFKTPTLLNKIKLPQKLFKTIPDNYLDLSDFQTCTPEYFNAILLSWRNVSISGIVLSPIIDKNIALRLMQQLIAAHPEIDSLALDEIEDLNYLAHNISIIRPNWKIKHFTQARESKFGKDYSNELLPQKFDFSEIEVVNLARSNVTLPSNFKQTLENNLQKLRELHQQDVIIIPSKARSNLTTLNTHLDMTHSSDVMIKSLEHMPALTSLALRMDFEYSKFSKEQLQKMQQVVEQPSFKLRELKLTVTMPENPLEIIPEVGSFISSIYRSSHQTLENINVETNSELGLPPNIEFPKLRSFTITTKSYFLSFLPTLLTNAQHLEWLGIITKQRLIPNQEALENEMLKRLEKAPVPSVPSLTFVSVIASNNLLKSFNTFLLKINPNIVQAGGGVRYDLNDYDTLIVYKSLPPLKDEFYLESEQCDEKLIQRLKAENIEFNRITKVDFSNVTYDSYIEAMQVMPYVSVVTLNFLLNVENKNAPGTKHNLPSDIKMHEGNVLEKVSHLSVSVKAKDLIPDFLSRIFNQHPNLKKLELNIKDPVGDVDLKPIDLEHLTTLLISITSPFKGSHHRCSRFLGNLLFQPNLKRVELNIPDENLNYCRIVLSQRKLNFLTGLTPRRDRIQIGFAPQETLTSSEDLTYSSKHKISSPVLSIDEFTQPTNIAPKTMSGSASSDSLPEKKASLDNKTKNDDVPLFVNQFFDYKKMGSKSSQPERNERHNIFTHLKISAKSIDLERQEPRDLKLMKFPELSLEDFKTAKNDENSSLHYTTMQLTVSGEAYQMIPSLNAEDEIKRLVSHPEINVFHSKEYGQYYIKLKDEKAKEKKITLSLAMQFNPATRPWPPPNPDFVRTLQHISFHLNEKGNAELRADPGWELQLTQLKNASFDEIIAALQESCRTFTEGQLEDEELEGIDLLNAILKQRKGACRHRAIIFKALADHLLPRFTKEEIPPVRVIHNDCHAFVEVRSENKWFKRDLGGYPANVLKKPLSIIEENPFLQDDEDEYAEKRAQLKHFDQYTHYLFERLAKVPPAFDPNVLINLPSAPMLLRFNAAMLDEMQAQGRRYFYQHNVSDIECVEVKGEYKIFPEELHNFIKDAKPGDVLTLNCNNFPPAYNNMLDTKRRKIGAIPIPDGVVIFGLVNTQQHQAGEDFESRFPVKQDDVPVTLPENIFTNRCLSKPLPSEKYVPIDCYDDDNLSMFYPSVNFKDGGIEKIPGILDRLPADVDGAEIINGRWGDPDFDLLISTYLHKHPNKKILKTTRSYDLRGNYTLEKNADWHQVLNLATFDSFFSSGRFDNGEFLPSPGIFAQQAQGSTLIVLVSENLPEPKWAKWLEAAREKNISFRLVVAPSVKIPIQMVKQQTKAEEKTKQATVSPPSSSPISVIYTNDVHYTAEMKVKEKVDHTLSIKANMNFCDIWESISGSRVSLEKNRIEAKHELSQIWRWLEQGKTVLLKGEFSDEAAGQMESLFSKRPYLWLNGREQPFPASGKLIIVTDQPKRFVAAEQITQEIVVPDDRFRQLQTHYSENEVNELKQMLGNSVSNMQYSQLKAAAQDYKNQPYRHPLTSLALLSDKPREELQKLKTPTLQTEKKHADIIHQRLVEMTNVLDHSPRLFLIGPAGTGKSTTVLANLKQFYKAEKGLNAEIFSGMDNLLKWITQSDEKQMDILFVDEATLQKSGNFDIFEGLYDNPPALYFNGEYHPLGPNKKVIFASNFGKQQHEFFRSHGSVMLFDELPPEYLRKQFIQPGLEKSITGLQKTDANIFCDAFLNIYQILKLFKPDDLLSIRNFQAMCLHAAVLWEHRAQFTTIEELAKFVALESIQPQLNEQQLQEASEKMSLPVKTYFDLQKKLEKNAAAEFQAKLADSKRFVLTPSRHPVVRILSEELSIRQEKMKKEELGTMGQRGIFIEGPSGVGKSDIAIQALELAGFINVDDKKVDAATLEKAKAEGKCYSHISATTPTEVEQQLYRAFHEGYVVILDELNTMPYGESFRTMLAGRDVDGKKPAREGFFVIGTGNPPHFTRRQPLPEEIQNRLKSVTIDHYPQTELKSILQEKMKLTDSQAEKLAKDYLDASKKSPRPIPMRKLFIKAAHLAAQNENKRLMSRRT